MCIGCSPSNKLKNHFLYILVDLGLTKAEELGAITSYHTPATKPATKPALATSFWSIWYQHPQDDAWKASLLDKEES